MTWGRALKDTSRQEHVRGSPNGTQTDVQYPLDVASVSGLSCLKFDDVRLLQEQDYGGLSET